MCKVCKHVRKLKNYQSFAPDCISAEVLKLGGDVMKTISNFNQQFRRSTGLENATVIPICKKGSRLETSH